MITVMKQSLKMAVKAVLSSKMRSFLTMLGIIIGVMSLVVLVSLARGATATITDSVSNMGTDALTVTIYDNESNPIVDADIDKLVSTSGQVVGASPYHKTYGTIKKNKISDDATLTGIYGNYADHAVYELVDGRNIQTFDVENANFVTVIDEDTAKDLFKRTDVVGETISIQGYEFTIIGVAESIHTGYYSRGYTAYVPYTTLNRIGLAGTGIENFYVSVADPSQMDLAQLEVENFLYARLGYTDYSYHVYSSSSFAEMQEEILNTMMLLLGGIASISLIVGGIGIMNIMLVSVTERTREIGIRKAIGADNFSILIQFLIEALLICLIGGVIGLIFSMVILAIVSALADMAFTMSIGIAIVALSFSVMMGVVFGLYPAVKASKKMPIEALRYSA